MLKVPLIIRGLGFTGGEVRSDFVSLVDLFPTITDAAGLETPEQVTGRSLLSDDGGEFVGAEAAIRHRERQGHRKYMSDEQLDQFYYGRKAIKTEEYHYEITSNGDKRVLSRSDGELVDVPDSVRDSLRERLQTTLGAEFQSWNEDNSQLSESARENLRELGYIE